MEYLFGIISNLPYLKVASGKKILKLGACIKPVKLENIVHLLRLAHNRIDVVFDDEILETIMRSDVNFLRKIRNPEQYHLNEDQEFYLVDMVRMNYT